MVPRFEYFPTSESGSFFELRDTDSYRTDAVHRLSIFCSADGRFFRDSSMPLELESPLIGRPGALDAHESSISRDTQQILTVINQRSCEGGGCRIVGPELEIVNQVFLRVSGSAQNIGRTVWAGWGVCADFHDSIGIRCFNERRKLVAEKRVAFPYECVVPRGALRFEDAFPLCELIPESGTFTLEIDLVREGVAWYTPESARLKRVLEVGFEPRKTQLELVNQSDAQGKIALTFDGGSSASRCLELLEVLRRHQVRCTMFLTGTFIERYPEQVRQMVRDGHEIANHTLSHPRLCFDRSPLPCAGVDEDSLRAELDQAARRFSELTGARIVPLWRAPFGQRNSLVLLWGEKAGYRHIFWDFDSEDWRIGIDNVSPLTAKQAGERTLEFLRGESGGRGNILLFHLGAADSADPFFPWIEKIIEECRGRGFTLGTVSSLL